MERARRLPVGKWVRPWGMWGRRLLRLFLLSCHESLAVRSVDAHVPVQIAGLGEPQQAQLTLVRLFPAVDPQMFRERRTITERLLAGSTAIGPLAGMGPHVGRHAGTLRESPIANRTPERFLPGVGANVSRQIGRLAETLAAIRTPIGTLSGVRSQMGFERTWPGVRFPAEPTQVRFVVPVLAIAATAVLFFEGDSQRLFRFHLQLKVGLLVFGGTLWRRVVGRGRLIVRFLMVRL